MNSDDRKVVDVIVSDFEENWVPTNIAGILDAADKVDERLKPVVVEALLAIEVRLLQQNGITFNLGDYSALGELASGWFDLQQEKEKEKFGQPGLLRDSFQQASFDEVEVREIGPYRLVQQIGEGGMGSVWLAEQEKPVRRRVAIKRIRNEVGSKEAIARFEAERQALAIMDHQNIAKVLDAGTEPSGRPYFVMELVKGVPITTYCDQNRLSIKERLELMISICNAVQHAHQKGIIHRDLKPSNVLVSHYEGKAMPKIIDFGLAKALEHTTKLTDKTIYTEFGKVVGTLQYMSPEQAELNALDVDTRADVYSLGVLLYELLTGSTPIEKDTMEQNLLQLLLHIREKEPPKPSTRLSSSQNSIAGISEQRKISPARLKSVLRGELDWVVMKALERDRTRRYETASSLGDDLGNYLSGDPVSALPPSKIYLFRKFVGRHKGWVASAALILFLLIVGVVGISLGWMKAQEAREDAENQSRIADGERIKAVNASALAKEKELEAILLKDIAEERRETSDALLSFFQDDLLRLANPWEVEFSKKEVQKDVSLKEVVDRASKKFSPENYKNSSMEPAAYCAILKGLGDIQEGLGNYVMTEKLIQGAFDIASDEFEQTNPVYIESGVNLIFVYLLREKQNQAVNQFFDIYLVLQKAVNAAAEDAKSIRKRLIAQECMLAWLNAVKRRTDYRYRILPVWDQGAASIKDINALKIIQVRASLDGFIENLGKQFGEEHEVTLYARATHGFFSFASGSYEKARGQFEAIIEIAENKIAEGQLRKDDSGIMGCRQVLAIIYEKLKIKPESQLELARGNYDTLRANYGDTHPATMIAGDFLSGLLWKKKFRVEALEILRDLSDAADRRHGMDHAESLFRLREYVQCLGEVKRGAEAFNVLNQRVVALNELENKPGLDVFKNLYLTYYFLGKIALKTKEPSLAVQFFQVAYDFEKEMYPDNWSAFDTQSRLGEAQLRLGEIDKAEFNLKAGFQGLKDRQNRIPVDEKVAFELSVKRLIELAKKTMDKASQSKWEGILQSISKN